MPDEPKAPLASSTIRYVLCTLGATVLLELARSMATRSIDWWALGVTILPQAAALLIRLAQPDVAAPRVLDILTGGLLNRSTPPRSSAP